MSVKEESEKAGLKLNKMYGESNMETYIATCKIDIVKVMTWYRKVMTNLDSVLESRELT